MKKLLLLGIYLFSCCQFLEAQKITRLQSAEKGMQLPLVDNAFSHDPSVTKVIEKFSVTSFVNDNEVVYSNSNHTNYQKLPASVDISAHITRESYTSLTSKFIYSRESGALSEGFNNIFETDIEIHAQPAKERSSDNQTPYILDFMSNPNANSQSDTYKGIYWYTGNSDNGGVHTNSGVLNYWFYLLSTGGNGTNDKAFKYTVSGIGMQKAQAIAYRTLVTYLVPTSVYKDVRTYSVKSAEDFFGIGSNEALQTASAWDAVGVTENNISGIVFASGISHANAGIVAEVKVSRLYPNPTQNYLIIEYTDNKPGSRNAAIYDMDGKLMFNEYIKTVQGNNRLQINLPSLVDGNFILKVDNVHSGIFSVKH